MSYQYKQYYWINLWFNNSIAFGLKWASLCKHYFNISYNNGSKSSGIEGILSPTPIVMIAVSKLSKSYSCQGLFAVAISNTVHPNDHISAE